MGKDPQKRRLKGCPYTVVITCALTPPHNFIRETQHRTYATAMRAVRKAEKELQGVPGLRIVLNKPTKGKPRTAWQHILAV